MSDAKIILAEMEVVRQEASEGIDDLLTGAKRMTDWRYYVRTYPWLCMGGAAMIGYFAVPRRADVVQPVVRETAQASAVQSQQEETKSPKKSGAGSKLAKLATSWVVRSLVQYAAAQIAKPSNAESEVEGSTPPENGEQT